MLSGHGLFLQPLSTLIPEENLIAPDKPDMGSAIALQMYATCDYLYLRLNFHFAGLKISGKAKEGFPDCAQDERTLAAVVELGKKPSHLPLINSFKAS
ncbi:hypothetical protein RJ641_003101 [Dillenia turbinata]|uniref:Uncharacterized protein n=1 Tax=Dillenia turbinata TaxID=194707 RepID=A0AAN8ZEY3_9MAGN